MIDAPEMEDAFAPGRRVLITGPFNTGQHAIVLAPPKDVKRMPWWDEMAYIDICALNGHPAGQPTFYRRTSLTFV